MGLLNEAFKVVTKLACREGEKHAAKEFADDHCAAAMETLREEFPELLNDSVDVSIVPALVHRALERAIEHML